MKDWQFWVLIILLSTHGLTSHALTDKILTRRASDRHSRGGVRRHSMRLTAGAHLIPQHHEIRQRFQSEGVAAVLG